jgi:aminotransferase
MPKSAQLVSQFTESVIRRSTVWSIQHGAVNLSQGFPDDETPKELKQAAVDAILGNRNQYSDTWGTEQFRQAIADKVNLLYGLNVNGKENVTVTCGATEAMMASLLAVVNPGDEVIMFEPTYENFRPHCFIARAKPILVPLREPDYGLDREALSNAFTEKTAAIIINNPNNPSGKVFTREELTFIANLCQQHDAVAISDEVYEFMVFDGRQHICLGSLDEFDDRWIVVSSCSKSYFITGWRIGYAISKAEFTNGIRRCHDFLSGVAPTPFQDAATVAVGFDQNYYDWLLKHYTAKRKLLVDILNSANLKCSLPEGAYYVLADMAAYDFNDSVEFCDYLMKQVGIAAVPWPSFYSRPELGKYRLRFTFSKTVDAIQLASDRLKALSKSPLRNAK